MEERKSSRHNFGDPCKNLPPVRVTISVAGIGRAVRLGGIDSKMDIDGALHSLDPKGSPAVLDIAEFLLKRITVRQLLGDVENLAERYCLPYRPNLGGPLKQADQLTSIVKAQNPLGALTESEHLIEEICEKFQGKPSVRWEFLLREDLGDLLQDVDGKIAHTT